MVEIEDLKNIIHAEKIKKPLPKFDGQTRKEWRQEMDNIIDTYIPYGHEKVNITEYGERLIRPHLLLERLNMQEALLRKSWHMLLLWAMYPIALLIFIVIILNWG